MEQAFTMEQQGFTRIASVEVVEGAFPFLVIRGEGGETFCRDIRFGERSGDVKARYMIRGWTDDACCQLELDI